MIKLLAAVLLAGLSLKAAAALPPAETPLRPVPPAGPSGAEEPPLHQAAAKGDLKRTRKLLDGGTAVDAVNDRNQTALHVAAGQDRSRERAQAKVAALLLDRGAAANAPDSRGGTPLSVAAARGSGAVVRLLLKRGAKAESADKNGMTPLMWASMGKDRGIVKALLKAGAKVDSVNKNGQTPLFLANANGRTRMADLLRSRGAD